MAAKPYVREITTSTTEGSTTLPTGLKITKIVNLDAVDNIVISFDDDISATDNKATLTPTNDTIDWEDVGNQVGSTVIYWDASANTPILRIIGYIS